jgi:uncharacterized protein (TIGR02145 family)
MKKNGLISFFIIVILMLGLCKINSNGSERENCNSHIIITDSGNDSTGIVSLSGYDYKTVKIGTQWWFAENLQTTQYNDGTSISNVTNDSAWVALTTGAYCWYDNNISNKATYGALYNCYAVNTGKLCPSGWHVPSNTEFITLTTFLGGTNVSGGKMKSTTGWNSPNTGATNESGFSGLPGGTRYYNGAFDGVGNYGNWWSSTESSTTYAWGRHLDYDYTYVIRTNLNQGSGLSVRCLRDN